MPLLARFCKPCLACKAINYLYIIEKVQTYKVAPEGGEQYNNQNMKTTKSLFLIAPFLIVHFCSAQSFTDTTKMWSIISMDTGGGPYQGNLTTTHFKFSGDTIINSETYHILYNSLDDKQQNWRIDSFWREKNDSIFKRYPNADDVKLIYDFTLEEKDTFKVDENFELYVDSVRIKEWGGKERKHLYLSSPGYEQWGETIWIEGVGNIGVFLYSTDYRLVGAVSSLLCFTENGELVYQNPEYNSCSVNTSVPTVKKEPEIVEVFSIAENLITVNPLTSYSGIVQIYDIIGNQITQKEIELTENRICLPKTGTYIYRFISKTGEVQNGKIVVR